ncbi:MAG: hypothetical protein AB7K24_32100 [Gemmataceae bacterium]
MAKIFERFDSRGGSIGPDSPRRDLRYTVVDADESTATALVESHVPAFFEGLVFQNYDLEQLGGGVFDVVAHYSDKKQDGRDSPSAGSGDPGSDGGGGDGGDGGRTPKQAGDGPQTATDWDFSFDTTGGTSKIFQYRTAFSKVFNQMVSTVRTIASGVVNKVNFQGAINVRQQGTKEVAEGVEISIPQFSFTLKGIFRPPLPANFVTRVYKLTAHVNSDRVMIYAHGALLTFEAGELLFRGATGGIREGGDVELMMNFVASENAFLEGIIENAIDDFNNPVDGITKKGHEYLWFRYQDEAIDNRFVPKPVQAFVGDVYPTAALSQLLTPFR